MIKSGSVPIYGNPIGNGVNFTAQEDPAMDLDELAKHLGIKVSEGWASADIEKSPVELKQ